MNESAKTPAQWMESLLERVLPSRTREEIVGDLREEYIESVLPQRGCLRADLWYLRQVMSFAPTALRESRTMGKLLIFVSGFTMVCMFWLASMEVELRHRGYGTRMAMDVCFALNCLAAAIFRMLPSPRTRSELCLRGSGLLMIFFGVLAFLRNANAAHFEGFAFVVSIVLVVQGLLMVMTLGRRGTDGAMLSAQ